MRLQLFNGGLNIRHAPHLIQPSEGTEFTNINDSKGALYPVKCPLVEETNVDRYSFWFEAEQRWVRTQNIVSWVEFQERLLYVTNGKAYKEFSGNVMSLGLQYPTTKPLAATVETDALSEVTLTPVSDSCYDANEPGVPPACTNTGNLPTGRKYIYKLVNNVGLESYESEEFSITLPEYVPIAAGFYATGRGSMHIKCVDPKFGDTVDVYRQNNGVYHKVGTLLTEATVLVDNVWYIQGNDSLSIPPHGVLTGTYQYAITWFRSIDGAESVPVISNEVVTKNQQVIITEIEQPLDTSIDKLKIYRIGGDITTFSLIATIDVGTNTYTDNIEDVDIIGTILTAQNNFPPPLGMSFLLEHNAMIFGATEDKVYFTAIGRPDVWPQTFYLDFPTTVTALGQTPVGVLVCTRTKTYLVSGTSPTNLSQQLLDGSQGCINFATMSQVQGNAIWASDIGICVSNGGEVTVLTKSKLDAVRFSAVQAVVHDMTYYLQLEDGRIFALDFDANTLKYFDFSTSSISVGNGRIYGWRANTFYELFSDRECDSAEYVFKSADFIIGEYTTWKTYKSVYVHAEADATIEIFLDGQPVRTYTTNVTDVHEIKLPNKYPRATHISFRLTGRGVVNEIYWGDNSANV